MMMRIRSALGVLCLLSPAVLGQPGELSGRPLFGVGEDAIVPAALIPDEARRVRALDPDFGVLSALDEGSAVTFDLFDDRTLTGVVTRVSVRDDGDTTWFGTVDGPDGGTFVLVVEEGLVSGRIDAGAAGLYELLPCGDGFTVAVELDPMAFPACGNGPEQAVKADAVDDDAGLRAPCNEDGSVINVLVVYSTNVTAALGSQAAARSLAQAAVDAANDAYANSNIGPLTLNLVDAEETNYNEFSSFSGHLSLITNPSDGVMDEVQTLREVYQADMVSLLVTDTEYCGIAWLMSTNSTGWAPNAFSVVSTACAVGNLSFAHELGHNMSCAHDRDNAGGSLYPYGYGYRFRGNNGVLYRTVMAYSPGSRRAYFSNPDVSYQGTPTGVPVGQSGQADNALAIDNTRATVANFRNNCSDCNGNLIADATDIANGTSLDCNHNQLPDECDIADGTSQDCNGNGVPDECDGPDCNGNGIPDDCDLADGTSQDCNGNGIPDECEGPDCNGNGIPDECDLASGTSQDCNGNGIPDECDLLPQPFSASSGQLSPLGFDSPQSWTVSGANEAVGDVTLGLSAKGDLANANERVSVFVGQTLVGFAFETTGSLCPSVPDTDQLVVPVATWNAARDVSGSVKIDLYPNSAVSPTQCVGGSYIEVSASFDAAPLSVDDNGDGTPDECTLVECIADLTTQGAGVGDPGYGVPDGGVTAADLNYFVNAWVAGDAGIADMTTQGAGLGDAGYGVPDGGVTAADLNYYVNLWVGPCP